MLDTFSFDPFPTSSCCFASSAASWHHGAILRKSCTSIGRELTQASNVTDDLILVQMGAVPEGLSAEKKEAFVVGLRHIIQEIRGRKVKDFRIVASEIAAYRARFLGDSSKILPL